LNQHSQKLIERFAETAPANIAVCSIVKAELFYGAMKSAKPAQNLIQQQEFLEDFQSLPFDDLAAQTYAEIRTNLERIGSPIGPNDLCIAAIALANGLTLISNNIKEFKKVARLKLEDWSV
jgi:tRNA(fMet)-specific endonuclease VapC